MGLFGFGIGKKKEDSCCSSNSGCCSPKEETVVKAQCACGNECGISDIEKSRIIVLGSCCKKSSDTFENVKKAVSELGLNEEVLNIGDMAQIAQYGVMQTPALVIDSKVVSYGKLIKVDEAKKFIESAK